MSGLRGALLLLAWFALFLAPAVLLFWAMGPGWELVAERTGWSPWVSIPATVLAALVLALAWIMVVWPRLFGYRRATDAAPPPTTPENGAQDTARPDDPAGDARLRADRS